MKKFSGLTMALFFAAFIVQTAGASTIDISFDLTDVTKTENGTWGEYGVTLQNNSDLVVFAFSIYFDFGMYTGLSYNSETPYGWNVIYTDPYDNMGPEYPGELRMYNNDAGLRNVDDPLEFSIGFEWLSDDLASILDIEDKPFVVNVFDPVSDMFYLDLAVVNGVPDLPAPVPEPQTFMLLGAGLMGIAAYCRHNRSRSRKTGKN